nr:hypothetical protein [uncultured Mucilaginibacter sp.]
MLPVKRLLHLQLYQAETLISNSKKYNFSDTQKDNYLKTLSELFEGVKSDIEKGFDDAKIFDKKRYLDFIFKSLEFLKDSTLNTIPFEVVGCLNKAMSDWIDASKFIIVTSLQNNLYSFSYDLSYANNKNFYESLETEYGVTFDQKLVQINLPLTLSKDYLSSVALYHELGHFVDLQHSITSALRYAIELKQILGTSVIEYLPFLTESVIDGAKLKYHLGEFFCDLFAAQYIGNTIGHFLEYITNNSSEDSPTHPSTKNRVKVITDFITGNANPMVDLIQAAVESLTGKPLDIRYSKIDSDDFYKLIPYNIESDAELHGCILYGWNVWLNESKKFNECMGYDVKLSEPTVYKVINSLVEKSIGNYFTVQQWERSKI